MFPVMSAGNPITGYNINNSLRFRSSASAYLSRTPATTTNQTTATFSIWFKRGRLGQEFNLFNARTGTNFPQFDIRFTTGDVIDISQAGSGGVSQMQIDTTQVFRDTSAWYHIVVAFDTTQATASNRVKLYVNGSQVTAFSAATYPAQNQTMGFNTSTVNQYIGAAPANAGYFDGYLTEINFIDGQALTSSSFGATDAITGQWLPKQYSGTYGTNGFYLPFSNIATTSGSNTGLGKDFSGNGNYWNTNNISVTAGTTYDAMIDSPTLTSATVANYATWLALRPTLSQGNYQNGNLEWYQTSAGSGSFVCSSIGIFSGKWYAEFSFSGSVNATSSFVGFGTMYNIYSLVGYRADGKTEGGATFGASFTTGDILGVAYDQSTNTATFYKNNVSQGTQSFTIDQTLGGAFVASTIGSGSTIIANFGQRPFTYTPPTGFVALNTYNLPTPTIKAGNKYMDATLWTGNGASRTISGYNFLPDFSWIKSRSAIGGNRAFDTVRGATKALITNLTNAEATESDSLTAFTSTGYSLGADTVGGGVNQNGVTYVGWGWSAGNNTTSSNTSGSITSTVSVNTTAGFSILTYTGNGTAGATIGHGLGVAPKMIIVKNRSNAGNNWPVYVSVLGNTGALFLSATAAFDVASAYWNNTSPTSTVFSVGSSAGMNGSTQTYVAYCWADVSGYSKAFSYTGNASSDGPFIYCGFRPKFILIKGTATGRNWVLFDSSRNTYNASAALARLKPNTSDAEDGNEQFDFLSNGFKIRNYTFDGNANGETYIGMAFAENPFKNANAR